MRNNLCKRGWEEKKRKEKLSKVLRLFLTPISVDELLWNIITILTNYTLNIQIINRNIILKGCFFS